MEGVGYVADFYGLKQINMNYYKGLEEIGKTGEFKNIPDELLHDYINDFTLEFNNRSLVKKLNIAVVVGRSEQFNCLGENYAKGIKRCSEWCGEDICQKPSN